MFLSLLLPYIDKLNIFTAFNTTTFNIFSPPTTTTRPQFTCSTAAVSTFGACQYENGRLGQVRLDFFFFRIIRRHRMSSHMYVICLILPNFSDGASNNKDEWFV